MWKCRHLIIHLNINVFVLFCDNKNSCRASRCGGALQLWTRPLLLDREWRGHTWSWVDASQRTGSLARLWTSQGSHPKLCCRYQDVLSLHSMVNVLNVPSSLVSSATLGLVWCFFTGHYVIPGTHLTNKGQASEILSKTLLPSSNCTVSTLWYHFDWQWTSLVLTITITSHRAWCRRTPGQKKQSRWLTAC